jgi:hypothetical protein
MDDKPKTRTGFKNAALKAQDNAQFRTKNYPRQLTMELFMAETGAWVSLLSGPTPPIALTAVMEQYV